MSTVPKITITTQLSPDDVMWLTEQAEREAMSRSALVRQAINWYRNEREAIAYIVAEVQDHEN